MKLMRKCLIVLCVAGICFSAWNLWQIYGTYERGKALYQELSQLAVQEAAPTIAASTSDNPENAEETKDTVDTADTSNLPNSLQPDIAVDFDALTEFNPDTVGWIYCPDTMINYPVVQGEDNDYYLDHLLDGTSNSNGTIFMDCRNTGDLSIGNTILYGHHMKNGSMFAALEGYREQSYYDDHPVIYYLTPMGNYALYPFFGGVVSANDEAYTHGFSDETSRQEWIARQKSRSDFQSDVPVEEEEGLVTLSTCAYDFSDARYVVVAKAVPLF